MKKLRSALAFALLASSAAPALAQTEALRPAAVAYAAPAISDVTTVLTGKARLGKTTRTQSKLFGGGGFLGGMGLLPFLTALSGYLGYTSLDQFRNDLRAFLGLGNSPV